MSKKVLAYIDDIPIRVSYGEIGANPVTQLKDVPNLDLQYAKSSQNHQGRYTQTSLQTLSNVINGGSVFPDNENAPEIRAPVTAELQFKVSSYDGYMSGLIPQRRVNDDLYYLSLNSINATLSDAAAIPPPFTAVKVWGESISTFKYKGKQDYYSYLKGNLDILVRTSDKTPAELANTGSNMPSARSMWLEILTLGTLPTSERYDRIGMAIDNGDLNPPQRLSRRTFNSAPPLPEYADITEAMLSKVEWKPIQILFDRRIQAYSNSIGFTYAFNNLSTDWFVLGAGTTLYLKTDKPSKSFRIQWMDKHGNVWYADRDGSDATDPNKLVSIPAEATHARCWFSSANDQATKIDVCELPREIDILHGLWVRYSINVDSMFKFTTNTEYAFTMRFYNGGFLSTLDQHSFLIMAGGINSVFNARDGIQTNLNAAYKKKGG